MALRNVVSVLLVCSLALQAYGQGWDALNVANKAVNPPQPQYPGDLRGGFDIGKVRVVPDIKAFGSGNNRDNYQAFGSASLGAKLWESKNGRHQLGAGVSVNKAKGATNGFKWESDSNYGGGLHYQYNFGR